MPKVHFVKKARKAIKAIGVEKGDSYYWWKFRYGGKRCSKTRPKPSQLTQSEFLSSLYSIQENIEGYSVSSKEEMEEFASALEDAASEIQQLGEDCSGKADNMENAFPNGNPTIELLRERAEACDRISDELSTASSEAESKANDGGEEKDFVWESEASYIIESIDWSVE